MKIAENVAVLTGAASGIGQAVAVELVQRGARGVGLVDRNPAVHEFARRLNQEAQRPVALAFCGDVTDAAFRIATFDQLVAQLGVPRICIPAAGITRDALSVKLDKQRGQVAVYSPDDFAQVLNVNLTAATYWALETIARVAKERTERGERRWEPREELQGAIVLIGSVSSRGMRGQVAYAASKAGLSGVAQTLNQEAVYYGVRCSVVHPGFTDTPLVQALGERRIQDEVLPHTQLRRLIDPAEIARVICFLVENPIVSGSVWADAGWHPPA
ncbi:MAG: SDR family NAD(P)-dependent oxidoreductase [Planctomycetota bacterium]